VVALAGGKDRTMVVDILPKNLVVRRPTLDDVKAASEVMAVCDLAEHGEIDITEEDMHSEWSTPGFSLETDAWVVQTPEGRVIAFADVGHQEHAHIFAFARVHPDFRGQGIGTHLLHLAEARAHQHVPEARPDARVVLNTWASVVNQEAQQLFEHEGFQLVRKHWHMQIEMDATPAAPEWAEGITVRTFVLGQDNRTVFDTVDEAFQDHWGHMPMEFDRWEHWTVKRDDFDPSLWFLAFEDDQLAGVALCYNEATTGLGWVATLGVRRPWRRRGVGMALLRHSFGEFYRRGMPRVKLGVDSQNLTGATRLYKRAGMHVVREFLTYEKELRAGVELSTQSIIH
jgi:mycothiol synthase